MHFGDYTDPVSTLPEDLVNSYSHSLRRDLLDRSALARIAAARSWSGPGPTAADIKAVRSLRHRLRSVFEAADDRRAAAIANEMVAESGLVPQLVRHDDSPWHLHLDSPSGGLPEWLAGVAGFALLSVIERGDGHRLRQCEGPDCHAVFLDVSRNQSRRYCSPALCGNRVHVAAHRSRRAQGR